MRNSQLFVITLSMLGAVCTNLAQAAPIQTFDTPVTIGATQAPGVWYTDRYAPAGFVSPVNAIGGRNGVLQHSISAADSANNRPGGFSASFYNTQGRKYDLPSGTTSMSIDLFIPGDWATSGRRMAGFWGTAFDATNAVSEFPILSFNSDGGNPRFQYWNGAAYVDFGLPTGFAYDQWYTLGIDLIGTDFVYTVGDLTASFSASGSTYIGNTILQGHNTTTGVTYDIYWDNLQTPSAAGAEVPEPASLALWGMIGAAGLAGWRKRKLLAKKS